MIYPGPGIMILDDTTLINSIINCRDNPNYRVLAVTGASKPDYYYFADQIRNVAFLADNSTTLIKTYFEQPGITDIEFKNGSRFRLVQEGFSIYGLFPHCALIDLTVTSEPIEKFIRPFMQSYCKEK